MKKKKLSIVISIGILALLLVGCSSPYSQTSVTEKYDDTAKTPSTGSVSQNAPSASWIWVCDSVESLVESSEIIAIGRVIGKETERRHDMVFTHHEVEISTVYHGDVREGESVTVFITGGEMDGYVTTPFYESPLLEMGGEYMLFLVHTHDPDYDYHFPAGGYQGVFEIADGTLRIIGERQDVIAQELGGISLASVESVLYTILSAELAGWYNHELPVLEGVRLTTELGYYAEGTARLLTFWENNSEIPITFGEPWQLEYFNNDWNEWTVVRDMTGVAFMLPGYCLTPGMSGKHTYWLSAFQENITEGLYRIRTDFHDSNITGTGLISYGVSAEFVVTSDSSLLRRSELDYDDLENSTEITVWPAYFNRSSPLGRGIDFPLRVYKNRHTFDTTIVIGGEAYYRIAEGTGRWGVVTCNYFVDGEDRYLIYSYSRDDETGAKLSYIGIFDLNKREEIFRSEAFTQYDITINERSEERHYSVAFMTHFEDGYGGGGGSLVSELGYLKYEDGEFNLYIANA